MTRKFSEASNGPSSSALHELLEEFQQLLASGKGTTPEDFALEHSNYREELLQILPIADVLLDLSTETCTPEIAKDYEPPTKTLGDYRIIREIGRGGMGLVYEAQQLSLDRRVALKILPLACLLGERQIHRFHNEARAAASLRHPNIVGVHGVGCERAVHFYSMELVRGCDLASIIRAVHQDCPNDGTHSSELQSNATNPIVMLSTQRESAPNGFYRSIAKLGVQAAEALHHAHEHGIIHRDIKPANLLFDELGNVRITDFGLALIQTGGDSTKTAGLVGTLRYMSPEQLRGEHVDARSDIYSLGITLYELCCGKPAFDADSPQELRDSIVRRDVQNLRLIDAKIPSDLEIIIDKAIAKEAYERYQDANQMAADLKRFLDHRPIVARRSTILHRFSRFAKRNPSFTLLLAVTTILFAILAFGSAAIAWKSTKHASWQARQHSLREYASDVRFVEHALNEGRYLEAEQRLLRWVPEATRYEDDLRGFEWGHLWERCHPTAIERTITHATRPFGAAFSPDGNRLADAWLGGRVTIWNLDTAVGLPLNREFELQAMGVRIAQTFGNRLVLCDASCGVSLYDWNNLDTELKRIQIASELDETTEAHSIDIDQTGRLLAVGGDLNTMQLGFVEVWDIDDRRLLFKDYKLPNAAFVSFDGAGDLVVVCRGSHVGYKHSLSDSVQTTRFQLDGAVSCARRSQDRNHLAIGMIRERGGSFDSWIELRQFENLDRTRHLFSLPNTKVSCLGFSPSTDRLSAGDETGRLWTVHLASNNVYWKRIHEGQIHVVNYSPDNSQMATAGVDRQTNLLPSNWDELASDGSDPTHLPSEGATFRSACFLDNHQIAVTRETSGIDVYNVDTLDRIRSWSFNTGTYPMVTADPNSGLIAIAEWRISHGSRRVTNEWKLQIRNRNGKALFERQISEGFLATDYSISQDGKYLVSANPKGAVLVNLKKHDAPVRYIPFENGIKATAFSPDSATLVCAAANGQTHFLDVATLKPRRSPFVTDALFPFSVCFIPGTRKLAVVGFERKLKIFDMDSGELVSESSPYASYFNHVMATPDGKRLAVGSIAGRFRLFRTEDCAELLSFPVKAGFPRGQFSPNGKSLLISSWDQILIVRGLQANIAKLSVSELQDAVHVRRSRVGLD